MKDNERIYINPLHYEIISKLQDSDRLALFDAIFAYTFSAVSLPLPEYIYPIWESIISTIELEREKRLKYVESRRANGSSAKKRSKRKAQANLPRLDTDETSDETEFGVWWNLYDKKVGRDSSLKKWARMTDTERRQCISATSAYVSATPDKAYRKNPTTYLNGKCWNDEIIKNNETDKYAKSRRADVTAESAADYTRRI